MRSTRLLFIKIIHTLVWLFFNVVLFYLLYAAVSNNIDKRVWIGLGFIAVEGIILVIFKLMCPLTIIARKYSNSTKANFDIFLPNWLARHNKLAYTILLGIILVILVFRLFTR